MSQAAPSSDKAGKKTASPKAPPDEAFWQRYSPHAELPLSSAGSLVVHVLALGLMVLLAWVGSVLLNHSSSKLPVEAVQLAGGGGDPRARGPASSGGADPIEAGKEADKNATEEVPNEDVATPKIDIKPDASKPKFDDSRPTIQSPDEANKVFSNLRVRAGSIRTPGSDPKSSRGYGKGGTGTGGGSGSGTGRGVGSGTGEGSDQLTQREKRQRRWNMAFNVHDSADYVAQIRAMGAILAIPIAEHGDDFEYAFVRDFSARPAKLVHENLGDVARELGGGKMWTDTDPKSASGVLRTLGIAIPKISPQKLHFAAMTGVQLERKLLKLELDYLHRQHARASEDDIEETRFRMKKIRNGQYEPAVESQTLTK